MKTKERLAKELNDAARGEKHFATATALLEMSKRAETGYYDDYESPLATPIVQLVTDLTRVGRSDLATRARDGEWDATKEEAEEWAKGPEAQELFRQLKKGK